MRKSPKRPMGGAKPSLPEVDLQALDTTDRVINFCVRNRLIDGAEVNIERIIEMTPNLTLVKKPLEEGKDAYIKEIGEGEYEIGVNSKHSITRQRFSMAHEFAHFQLHRGRLAGLEDGERILHRSDERNFIEQQANSFAAEILMPEDIFREEVRNSGGSVAIIAKRFGVSQLAARYRAKNLGMRGHGV